jgi:hypothetical protein
LCVACAGGEITSTFDCPEKTKLGQCQLIEEIMIGEDKLLKFSGEFVVVEVLAMKVSVTAV